MKLTNYNYDATDEGFRPRFRETRTATPVRRAYCVIRIEAVRLGQAQPLSWPGKTQKILQCRPQIQMPWRSRSEGSPSATAGISRRRLKDRSPSRFPADHRTG